MAYSLPPLVKIPGREMAGEQLVTCNTGTGAGSSSLSGHHSQAVKGTAAAGQTALIQSLN
jgi:hypothetical protein